MNHSPRTPSPRRDARRICWIACLALLLPLLSAANTSRLLPRDEDDAGIHRLAQVTLLASRRDIVTMGDNYQLLLSAGIDDDQLADGSLVAARVYCCGGPNEKSEEIWAWVPGTAPAALGDVIEVRMGDEKAAVNTEAVNAVVAVRATQQQVPGRCRWDPPDESLWVRILYCEGIELDGWKQRNALMYPMWLKRRDSADDGAAAAPAPDATPRAGSAPSATTTAVSYGVEAFARGDPAAALTTWLPEVDAGDPTAQTLVGTLYFTGRGVARDDDRALRLMDLAGEHFAGIDFAQVFGMWQPLADRGDPAAQYVLGRLHVARDTDREDYEIGLDWLRKSAAQNYPAAQSMLGACYLEGAGVERDYKEAMRWFRLAADKAEVRASYDIGLMYERGEGVRRSNGEAARWYRIAAEGGLAEAAHKLANFLSEGAGVPRDKAEALRWYRTAAARGFADSANNIGRAYATGEGVSTDIAEAYKWFSLATHGKFGLNPTGPMLDNLDRAANMLGVVQRRDTKLAMAVMCEEGREVPIDPAQAWFWYELALHDPANAAWAETPEGKAAAVQQARIGGALSPTTLERVRTHVRGWGHRWVLRAGYAGASPMVQPLALPRQLGERPFSDQRPASPHPPRPS